MYEGECGNAMQLCETAIQLERQSARVKDDSKTSLSCYGQLVSIHQNRKPRKFGRDSTRDFSRLTGI